MKLHESQAHTQQQKVRQRDTAVPSPLHGAMVTNQPPTQRILPPHQHNALPDTMEHGRRFPCAIHREHEPKRGCRRRRQSLALLLHAGGPGAGTNVSGAWRIGNRRLVLPGHEAARVVGGRQQPHGLDVSGAAEGEWVPAKEMGNNSSLYTPAIWTSSYEGNSPIRFADTHSFPSQAAPQSTHRSRQWNDRPLNL